jgi:hypothetical protein
MHRDPNDMSIRGDVGSVGSVGLILDHVVHVEVFEALEHIRVCTHIWRLSRRDVASDDSDR